MGLLAAEVSSAFTDISTVQVSRRCLLPWLVPGEVSPQHPEDGAGGGWTEGRAGNGVTGPLWGNLTPSPHGVGVTGVGPSQTAPPAALTPIFLHLLWRDQPSLYNQALLRPHGLAWAPTFLRHLP